jgi:hypothetical protein
MMTPNLVTHQAPTPQRGNASPRASLDQQQSLDEAYHTQHQDNHANEVASEQSQDDREASRSRSNHQEVVTPAKKQPNFYSSPAFSSGDMLRSEITRESLEIIDTVVASANNVDGSIFMSADVFPLMKQPFSAAMEEAN